MFPLLLLLFSLSATAAASTQSFLREPFDQIATVGEHVTLPCRVSDRRGVLQWTRDDFGLGSDRGLDGFARYTMTGSDDEGKQGFDVWHRGGAGAREAPGRDHKIIFRVLDNMHSI